MSSLLDFPILFDDVTILRPMNWQEQSKVVENTVLSEAGTDIVEVVRYDKLTIAAQFSVTSAWAKTFKEFSKKDSISVSRYDVLTETYDVRTMRIRNFTLTRRRKSEFVEGYYGLYDVAFNLEEF
jgi:hypothetical protein